MLNSALLKPHSSPSRLPPTCRPSTRSTSRTHSVRSRPQRIIWSSRLIRANFFSCRTGTSRTLSTDSKDRETPVIVVFPLDYDSLSHLDCFWIGGQDGCQHSETLVQVDHSGRRGRYA